MRVFRRTSKKEPSFLIYQMGKVGSLTVFKSLEALGIQATHTHDHRLAQDIISNRTRPLYVITGVREPLARNISAFFQNIDQISHPYFYVAPQDVLRTMPIKKLCTVFDRRSELITELRVSSWFEKFFTATDMPAWEFKRDAQVFKAYAENLEIWIYKIELFDYFEKAFIDRFSKEYGISKLELTNISESKWYSNIYRDFLSEFKISRDRYNKIYRNIDYFSYFYTADEVENYSSRFLTN